jgi:tetratricopeptide (TPR) repeat protein
MKYALFLCLLAAPVVAQDTLPAAPDAESVAVCPAAPDHAAEQADVIARWQTAPDEALARPLMDQLWRMWTDAPDDAAQALLDEGMAKREGYDFLGARDTFDALVEYCPDYAEGYNQRAFASFLRQEYDAALYDLDRALDITPDHIAAMSGKALTLMGLGQQDEAQALLREALTLNPWLKERAMVIEAPGTDL